MTVTLTSRLEKAASLVGIPYSNPESDTITVADIGCDHAYLSLYLVLSGKCNLAIASDLREGPLKSAKENISKFECKNKIIPVHADGLDGIEEYSPSDILICGMGGDTIIQILSRAEFIKKQGMRLILQPQTAFAELALYLADNGFKIHQERYAHDRNKAYRIIAAEYIGQPYELSIFDALVGKPTYREDLDSYRFFCQKMLGKIEKKIIGALNHNDDASALIALRDEIANSMKP